MSKKIYIVTANNVEEGTKGIWGIGFKSKKEAEKEIIAALRSSYSCEFLKKEDEIGDSREEEFVVEETFSHYWGSKDLDFFYEIETVEIAD